MDASTETRLQLKRDFTSFLDSDVRALLLVVASCFGGRPHADLLSRLLCTVQHGAGDYVGHIREMLARKQYRLLVDVNDLRAFNPDLTKKCVGWRPPAWFGQAGKPVG